MSIHQKILQKHGVSEDQKQEQTTETQTNQGIFYKQQEILPEFPSYNSQYIRPTSLLFPKSRSTYSDAKIPFGVVVTLYGPTVQEGFPSTSFGNGHIVRCERCRGYINPYFKFIRAGQDMKCNLCEFQQPVPSDYISNLDESTQLRSDHYQKPELSMGSFDIRAGQEYQARPPMPPTLFFLIDVSQSSQTIIPMFSQVLKQYINDETHDGQRTMFGLVTYDEVVHVYSLKEGRKMPQMYVLSDKNDNDIPVPDDLLVNLKDSKELVFILLEQLEKMFENNRVKNATAFTRALDISQSIFQHVGGKLFIISSSFTILKEPPFQGQNAASQAQRNYMLPINPYLRNKTSEMHLKFISVTTFIFSTTFCDSVTQGELVRYLNGDIFYYNEPQNYQKQFFYDFRAVISKNYSWESVFRLRASRGWRVRQIFGNYTVKSTDLLSVLNCDDMKTLGYELELEDPVCRTDQLYLQSALLYTTQNGERRIRIHNYCIPLVINIQNIYEYADSNAICAFMAKQIFYKMYKISNVNEIRNQTIVKIKEIINASKQTNNQELNEGLASLPMNILGLFKHPIFSSNYSFNSETDKLNALRIEFNYLGVDELMLNFVPYLFRIEDLSADTCYYTDEGQFVFPPVLELSLSEIEKGGLFLMDYGKGLFFYIAKNHDQKLGEDILGNKYMEVKEIIEDMMYSKSENQVNTRLYYLIQELRNRKYTKFSQINYIRAGEKSQLEQQFFAYLILDDFNQKYRMTYQSFYQMVFN